MKKNHAMLPMMLVAFGGTDFGQNPDANDLAMRDPALAALMGALPGQDFGADPLSQPGADFGMSPFDVSQNIGAEFGFGAGFGSAALYFQPTSATVGQKIGQALAVPAATQAQAQAAQQVHPAVIQAWQNQQMQQASTAQRESLIYPNKHSTTKVQRYSFSMSQALVLNTASALLMTLQPSATIRAQRIIANAPAPNFCLLSSLQIANVNVFVGSTEDAYTYSATAQGVMLDLPTLEPAYRATAAGTYSGLIPPGYATGFSFLFVITMQGPASIAGSVND
jgi:hypothetical protein